MTSDFIEKNGACVQDRDLGFEREISSPPDVNCERNSANGVPSAPEAKDE
jgi:hypothetical protein